MEVLGRYQLLRRIGVGGMAEVFLARALGEGNFSRTVVVKRMLPQLAEDKDAVDMFLDEARLGSLLRHPNIVPVLDLGRLGNDYFMVMDYVDGVNLGTIEVRARTLELPIPMLHSAWVVARAAEGLSAAHLAVHPQTGQPLSVVHRDVSPANILVSRTAEVRVADFGVARSSAQQSPTNAGVLKGKVSYMSPEQVLCGPLDSRSDIYSLGVVLWQLATGRRRFEGRNELRIMQSVLHEAVPSPRRVNPAVDAELERIIIRMTSHQAQRRYQTMKDAARDLDRYLVSQGHLGREDVEQWLTLHSALCETGELTPQRDAASPMRAAARRGEELPAVEPQSLAAGVEPKLSEEGRLQWLALASRKVRQGPHTTSHLVNGEAAIVSTRTQTLHTLNETATFIWQRADGQHSLQAIADELLSAFEVEPDAAYEAVMAFVHDAVEQGFLVFS